MSIVLRPTTSEPGRWFIPGLPPRRVRQQRLNKGWSDGYNGRLAHWPSGRSIELTHINIALISALVLKALAQPCQSCMTGGGHTPIPSLPRARLARTKVRHVPSTYCASGGRLWGRSPLPVISDRAHFHHDCFSKLCFWRRRVERHDGFRSGHCYMGRGTPVTYSSGCQNATRGQKDPV